MALLWLQVYDWDLMGADDFIGEATVALTVDTAVERQWVQLQMEDGSFAGAAGFSISLSFPHSHSHCLPLCV